MCDRSRNEVRWSHSIEKRAGKAGTILLRARRQAFRRNAANSVLKIRREGYSKPVCYRKLSFKRPRGDRAFSSSALLFSSTH